MCVINYIKVVLTHSGQPCHYPNALCLTLSPKNDCPGLALAGNKGPPGRALTAPCQWDGEENQKEKGKICVLG